MEIHTHKRYGIAYTVFPYKRDQDVIRFHPAQGDLRYAVSVVDGWNWKEKLADDTTGRSAAQFIADRYPQALLAYVKNTSYKEAAQRASELVDNQLLQQWPAYVSAVAVFLFSFKHEDVIVFVGKAVVLVHNSKVWEKPKEIGNYFLDETKFGFPNEVSRFFGRGELKGDPLYSCTPDVVVCPAGTPVFLASDGLDDVFTQEEITQIIRLDRHPSPRELMDHLLAEVSRRGSQRDDISVLVRL